jgi:hypothetical protein
LRRGGLRRIFGPKRKEVIGGCKELHNEELHDLFPTPRIIRIIKSWKLMWAGHVVRMTEKRNAYRFAGRKGRGKETTK